MMPIILTVGGLIVILWKLTMSVNPSSRLFKMFERACIAFVLLQGWNALASPYGLQIGVNLSTLTAAGCLGLPGLAAMAAARALL